MRFLHHKQRQAVQTLCRILIPCGHAPGTTTLITSVESRQKIESDNGPPCAGAGFTLLEMLLALALCGIVMSGVYGAIHLHIQLRQNSRDRISVARTSATIVDTFSTDLQSLARSLETVSQPDSQSTQHPRFETTEIEISDFSEQHLIADGIVNIEPVHFQGTSNYIVILTGSPNPHFPVHTTAFPSNAGHEFGLARQVAWWFSDGATIELPVRMENERVEYQVIHTGNRQRRIVRAERPVQYRSMQPRITDHEVLFPHVTEVGDDVTGMWFRYFDGRVWTNTWDSHKLKRFPTAVELTAEFTDDSRPPLTCVIKVPGADINRTQGNHL